MFIFVEGLSCTVVIRTVKEEMGWSFKLLAATTNKIYGILKIVPKFIISQVAQSKSYSRKNFQPFTTVNIKHLTGFRSNEFQYNSLKNITRSRVTNVNQSFSTPL